MRHLLWANNGGSAVDPIADLTQQLGGVSVMPALFDVHRNVSAPSNIMASISEARGIATVPVLTAGGTTKPTWDPTNLLMTGGSDGRLAMASANALYSFATIRTMFLVAVMPAASLNKTIACLTESISETRAMEINGNSGIATFMGGQTIASGVALSTNRRLIFVSHNGSTTGQIEVPDQAAVTHAITALASGPNFLTLFDFFAAGGFEAPGPIRAVGFLTVQPSAAQKAAIRRWAIAQHAAVPA